MYVLGFSEHKKVFNLIDELHKQRKSSLRILIHTKKKKMKQAMCQH
jgi:hypothetical protein